MAACHPREAGADNTASKWLCCALAMGFLLLYLQGQRWACSAVVATQRAPAVLQIFVDLADEIRIGAEQRQVAVDATQQTNSLLAIILLGSQSRGGRTCPHSPGMTKVFALMRPSVP